MTRLTAHHDLLDTVPPWPRPLVPDLRHAPELAVLAVLHAGLRAALVALTAEHPTLNDLGAHWMAGHRLVRAVIYDYASDRTVEACVDLDAGVVAHLELTRGQPMLSRDEEALAVSIAMVDDRVRERLALGDVPQSTLHYWGRATEDLAFARRSAAVVFGRADGHASVVAVVDLLENTVTQVVPAELW